MSEMRRELEDEGVPDLLDDEDAGVGIPRDHPTAVDDFGITADEQRAGETLEERIAREVPDLPEDRNDDFVGRLYEPQSEVDQLDSIAEPLAFETDESEGMSAEEAAMHITDEP